MYYPYFMLYLFGGVLISGVVFLWALKNGQFKDQQRARFLPLVNAPEIVPPKVSRFNRYEGYVLLFLAACGLVATGAVLAFAFWFGR